LKIGVIEVISIVPKTLFIFLAARHDLFPHYGILLFGVGALLYSLVFMAAFFIASTNKSLLLQPYQQGDQVIYVDPASKESLRDFTGTAILKYFLHEFEKVVLVLMDVAHISSIYSLISNLGSMVVRYLFAPLNEIIFNYFSRGDGKEAVGALVAFIRAVALFSFLILSFGYNYSQIFLTFLYGEKWVSPESVAALRTYMLLVVFLGFNGVMEAFLFAKGTAIMRYNFFSVITTCIYLASTFAFTYGGLGAAGLFLGNILNMALRIILCWSLEISQHIGLGELLLRIRPSLLFVVVWAAVFLAGHKEYGFAQKVSSNSLLQFLLGAVLFGVNLLPIVFENRNIILKYLQ
jgi:O-antigen/teichoic acid export membrane protein